MSHYGFVDAEEVLRTRYAPIEVDIPVSPLKHKGSAGVYMRKTTQQLENMLHIREYMSILISPYTGYETKFYTQEELYKKFGDDPPMDIEGEVIVFYNVEDACRILGLG